MSDTLVICNTDLVVIDLKDLGGRFELEFASGDGVVASVTARVDKDGYLVLNIADGMNSGAVGEFSFTIEEEVEESGQ